MMVYQAQPGVIQTSIAGEYLLVAAKEVQKDSNNVTEINETSAFLWQRMKTGCTIGELVASVLAEYEIDDVQEVQQAVKSFVRGMLDMGYIRGVDR